jgi:hypothetical protein
MAVRGSSRTKGKFKYSGRGPDCESAAVQIQTCGQRKLTAGLNDAGGGMAFFGRARCGEEFLICLAAEFHGFTVTPPNFGMPRFALQHLNFYIVNS